MAGLINYVKKVFKNYPDTSTPINAENLNHLDNGIYDLDQAVNTQVTQINASLTEKTANKIPTFWDSTTYSAITGIAYDQANKKLGLKVNGADTVIPFSSIKPLTGALETQEGSQDAWIDIRTRLYLNVADYKSLNIVFSRRIPRSGGGVNGCIVDTDTGTTLWSGTGSPIVLDISNVNNIKLEMYTNTTGCYGKMQYTIS